MTDSSTHSAFLSILLDPRSEQPLYKQLYSNLRQAILSGQLVGGSKLPSTRVLAHNLGVSRSTVVIAFEQLLYEGYIRGSVGSGSYVESVLPDQFLHAPDNIQKQVASTVSTTSTTSITPAAPAAPNTPAAPTQSAIQRPVALSHRGSNLAATAVAPAYSDNSTLQYRAFQHGVPALDLFPFKLWSSLASKRWREANTAFFGYNEPAGYQPLRKEIAAYVNAARGVHCNEEQVIIVAGSQQAIHLTAHLLLDEGDAVWIEEPCYLGARGALSGSGARLVPVAVDTEGLMVAEGIARCPAARMAYVTPSHQFPLGMTMSLSRRLALLQWATLNNSWIFEDDYDSEYRYAGRPLASLQGLDDADRVIYCGTFSKVLFPALRLGYLVVPTHLVDAFRAARATMDRHSPIFDQMVLTDFIAGDHFARHIRRMRNAYAERQAILIEAVRQELGGLLSVTTAQAGMHLVAQLPMAGDDRSVQQAARAQGVVVVALSRYYATQESQQGLLLGYTAFNQQQIEHGVQQLSRALTSI